jgi:hypothetical protein
MVPTTATSHRRMSPGSRPPLEGTGRDDAPVPGSAVGARGTFPGTILSGAVQKPPQPPPSPYLGRVAAFLVTYDLRAPGCQYPELLARLREFPSSYRELEANCLVAADGTADDVRDALMPHLQPGDGLLVTALSTEVASWTGLSPEARRWIHAHMS